MSSNFITFEIPPGIHEVTVINNILENSAKVNVSIDIITKSSGLKTNKVSRIEAKPF